MTKVALTQATIKAIHSYIDNYTLEDDLCTSADVKDVQFKQGDIDIDVDFFFWGHNEHSKNVHSEVPPPNIEYFTEYITDGGEITDIRAYDKDGELVDITNLSEI